MVDYLATLQQLEKPFAFEDHGIIRKKDQTIDNVYLLKEAIRRRMSLIDPQWSTGAPELVGIQGDVVVMRGTLTLLGATRTAMGTGKITRTRQYDNKRVEIEGYELAREESKAIKAAVSDLLPRLATEWNIGSYLRSMPKTIKTDADLKQWLSNQMDSWRKRYNTPQRPSQSSAEAVQEASPPATQPATDEAPDWWQPVMKDLKAHFKLSGETWDKFREGCKTALKSGVVTHDMSQDRARKSLIDMWNEVVKQAQKDGIPA